MTTPDPSVVGDRLASRPSVIYARVSSKEQEREADYLSAVILYRSGVDLDKARGFLVKLAKASGRTETGLLDTHPAGPERIAAWDLAVQEVRASNGGLPQRK